MTLKTTPLFDDHVRRGAQMAPFAGWNMPIQYAGIIAETQYTRQAVSCFDICHMGEFLLQGDLKRSGLDRIIASPLADLKINACRYGSMLNEAAGVIDDLLVYRKAQDLWMIVVNAATIEKDKEHFQKHLTKDAAFTDLSATLGKIDLQGPLARAIVEKISPDAGRLSYYTFIETDVLGEKNIISRTGYTGELGFEIYASLKHIPRVWQALLQDDRVKPAGLGSRDILRLEMGYSLYGQDIDETTTPKEAGLEKFIDFTKDFIGKDTLKNQTASRRRIFFKSLSRRSPRHGHGLFDKDRRIGDVTSGSFSPHLNAGIGMGFIRNGSTAADIRVGDERSAFDAVIADKPFIKKTSLKN
jgi:aminomethyltransferase